MANPWIQDGSYIPFPDPIAPITVDPSDPSSTFGLCINDAWQPAVVGCLKTLCRAETWVGSDSDIDTATKYAQSILGQIVVPCSSTPDLPPFACPGDLSLSDAPWATWTLGYVGIYVASQGYGPSYAQNDATNHFYNGVILTIDFSESLLFNNVHLVYDMQFGINQDSADFALDIQDVDNHVVVGTPITAGAMTSGFNKGYNTGAFGPTTKILIALFCDIITPTSISPVGNLRLTEVDISGKLPSGSTSPC